VSVLARGLLWAASAAGAFLALAWPFAVSADRDDATFRMVAIATTLVFFVLLAALCTARLGRAALVAPRRGSEPEGG
jgi:hypothetical protein